MDRGGGGGDWRLVSLSGDNAKTMHAHQRQRASEPPASQRAPASAYRWPDGCFGTAWTASCKDHHATPCMPIHTEPDASLSIRLFNNLQSARE
eukprot:scaffold24806_cov129-Isochrysis_galbana.AAC.2